MRLIPDAITKNFPVVALLGAVKRVLGQKTYLQLVPLSLGLFEATSSRLKAFPALLALVLLGISNLIPAFLEMSPLLPTLVRAVQLILMAYFAQFIARRWKNSHLTTACGLILTLNVFMVLLEHAIGPGHWQRQIFGVVVTRAGGLVGEPNFTAMLVIGVIGLALSSRLWLWSVLLGISLIPTFSRTALLLCALMALGLVVYKWAPKTLRYISALLFTSSFFLPLVFWVLRHTEGSDHYAKLARTTQRFYLVPAHIDVGIDNLWFGVGARNSIHFIKEKMTDISGITGKEVMIAEQHNLVTQVFSEYGLIGLGLFFYFCYSIFKFAGTSGRYLQFAWCVLLLGFSTVNGLSEIILFLFAGVVTSKSSEFRTWAYCNNLSFSRKEKTRSADS